MGSQAAKNAAVIRKHRARTDARKLILLDARNLDIFRVAADQCALETYSQHDQAGSRLHFRAHPSVVPREQYRPFDASGQDASVERAWRAQGANA